MLGRLRRVNGRVKRRRGLGPFGPDRGTHNHIGIINFQKCETRYVQFIREVTRS